MFNIGLVPGDLTREGDINWGMAAPELVRLSDLLIPS
jgi:hypothetical protein